jgi:hypothetical protein
MHGQACGDQIERVVWEGESAVRQETHRGQKHNLVYASRSEVEVVEPARGQPLGNSFAHQRRARSHVQNDFAAAQPQAVYEPLNLRGRSQVAAARREEPGAKAGHD